MKEIEVVVKMPLSHYYTIKDFAVTHSDQLIANGTPLPDYVRKIFGTEEKTGHWKKHDINGGEYYNCSRCACVAPFMEETVDKVLWKLSNYCPDCGAKMENGGEWKEVEECQMMEKN